MSIRYHVVLILALVSVLPAPAFDKAAESDRKALLSGLKDLPFQGVPGQLVAISPGAIPLQQDEEGFALAVAARFGEGRVLALAHDSLMNEDAAPDARAFMRNAMAWLRRKGGRVLCLSGSHFASFGRRSGVEIEEAKRLPASLEGYSLLYVGYPWERSNDYSGEELERVRAFVAKGGSLITGALGWVWQSYSEQGRGGAPLRDWSANRLLAPMGVLVGLGAAGARLPLDRAPTSYVDELATAFLVMEGRKKPKPAWLKAFALASEAIFSALPSLDSLMSRKALDRLLAAYKALGSRAVPSPDKPMGSGDPAAMACVSLLAAMGDLLPLESRPAYPGFALFPGEAAAPEAGAPSVAFALSSDSRWQSTGLYAAPGTELRLEAASAGTVFTIRVGAHDDSLMGLADRTEAWRRWPIVSSMAASHDGVATMAPLCGGLLYVQAGPEAEGESILISGAMSAPRYVLGRTGAREWRTLVARSGAPWGEIEGDRIVLTLPTSVLKTIRDPERIARFWDRAVDLVDELSGAKPAGYKERIVADEQISMGYMHSGYPIMCHLDAATVMGGVDPEKDLFTEGSWGLFHELGHDRQEGAWTFQGTGEVTVNIFTLYLMEELVGKVVKSHSWYAEGKAKATDYVARGRPFAMWKEDPFLALRFYVDLIDACGWEAFKAFFREYVDAPGEEMPKTDDDKRDQWLTRLSRIAGKDLGPVFAAWGVPVSAPARKEAAAYGH